MSMYGTERARHARARREGRPDPCGDETTLEPGRKGFITQALGGSFTVYLDGNLFRISGADADALGKDAAACARAAGGATDEDVEKLVWDQLRTCFDPEIPVNIVDLGLVYECKLAARRRHAQSRVKMTLTAPGCGMGDDPRRRTCATSSSSSRRSSRRDVELVFDPPVESEHDVRGGAAADRHDVLTTVSDSDWIDVMPPTARPRRACRRRARRLPTSPFQR